MHDELVVAIPNRSRGTWIAALVLTGPWEDEHVEVISAGHLTYHAAQFAAVAAVRRSKAADL